MVKTNQQHLDVAKQNFKNYMTSELTRDQKKSVLAKTQAALKHLGLRVYKKRVVSISGRDSSTALELFNKQYALLSDTGKDSPTDTDTSTDNDTAPTDSDAPKSQPKKKIVEKPFKVPILPSKTSPEKKTTQQKQKELEDKILKSKADMDRRLKAKIKRDANKIIKLSTPSSVELPSAPATVQPSAPATAPAVRPPDIRQTGTVSKRATVTPAQKKANREVDRQQQRENQRKKLRGTEMKYPSVPVPIDAPPDFSSTSTPMSQTTDDWGTANSRSSSDTDAYMDHKHNTPGTDTDMDHKHSDVEVLTYGDALHYPYPKYPMLVESSTGSSSSTSGEGTSGDDYKNSTFGTDRPEVRYHPDIHDIPEVKNQIEQLGRDLFGESMGTEGKKLLDQLQPTQIVRINEELRHRFRSHLDRNRIRMENDNKLIDGELSDVKDGIYTRLAQAERLAKRSGEGLSSVYGKASQAYGRLGEAIDTVHGTIQETLVPVRQALEIAQQIQNATSYLPDKYNPIKIAQGKIQDMTDTKEEEKDVEDDPHTRSSDDSRDQPGTSSGTLPGREETHFRQFPGIFDYGPDDTNIELLQNSINNYFADINLYGDTKNTGSAPERDIVLNLI
jgi:hypothetical protein